MIIALTGASGFVGSHVLDRALDEGHDVRALTRRPQPEREGVTWIAGDLTDPGALAKGAEAVIHVAGLVNAPDRAGFAAGNIAGTQVMLATAATAGVARFVHVSSLSAREPGLSDYGWSKAEAERRVERSDLDWTIVRPPGVFGPRDTETLPLFQAAKRRLVPLPPAGGRGSWMFAPDLADLLVRLATRDAARGETIEPDDGAPDGWDHRDFARAIATAVGARALPLPLPRPLLSLASKIGRLAGGPLAKLTADRVGYLAHPDWVSRLRPSPALWSAPTPTTEALHRTAGWYRDHGLL